MGIGGVPFSKWSQVRAEALSRLVRMGCAVKCADSRIQVEDRVAQYFHVGWGCVAWSRRAVQSPSSGSRRKDETVVERKLRRLPPVVVLSAAALAQRTMARGRRVTPSSMAMAAPVLGISICALAGSAGNFLRHRTTVDPVRVERAQHLVVDGPNRLTRNPMYLGLAGTLLAHAIARRSPSAVIPLIGFVWLIDRYQISAEEKALETRFGRAYLDYKEAVPRWLNVPGSSPGDLVRESRVRR